jgi:hypothetical protein
MTQLTDSEKDYMIKTQQETIDLLCKRRDRTVSFINQQIAWIKKEYPDKWALITILKTILNYISLDRVTISVIGIKHEVFQKDTTHRELVALTNDPANSEKVLHYGASSLFPDESVVVEDGMEFTI